ncbi:hypothetical protein RB595_007801 [Gaeumannomyces hyphopodioides]
MSFASPQPQMNAAQAEGRRVYIGNLNYDLQNTDIEEMLGQSGFPAFESVKIPLDQASGRNRGYAFVDFPTHEEADRAVNSLQAVIGGREIKVRMCEPKQQDRQQGGYNNYNNGGGGGYNNGGYNNRSAYASPNPSAYGSPNPGQQAWGGFDQAMGGGGFQQQQQQMQPDMRKLYVGGLGPAPDQGQNEDEIRMLFNGFNPTYISKRLDSNRAAPENPDYRFCFVEFGTPEEASAAKDALDGRSYGPEGVQLRVSFAKPGRSQQGQGQQQQRGGWGGQRQDAYNRGPQQPDMGGGVWRRG